ncbi:MAG: hypothetical protein PHX38_02645 [Sulfuricella sp.]|nr:hypothetical protein [Sulfuricella sp.]
MIVTMEMCSCQADDDYTSEVMCAGWNPDIATLQGKAAELAMQLIHHQSQHDCGMPAEVARQDVEAFLERMYASQR